MKKWFIAALALVLAVCGIYAGFWLFDGSESYAIKIVVPAGSTEAFVYSEEEISPVRGEITVQSGEGLGETEVHLKPVEVKQNISYEPEYLDRAMPAKLKAEQGGWFKIGISVQNPTEEDQIYYLHAEHVEVRISCQEETICESSQEKPGAFS